MPAITVSILGLVIMDIVIGLSFLACKILTFLRRIVLRAVDAINKPKTKAKPKTD